MKKNSKANISSGGKVKEIRDLNVDIFFNNIQESISEIFPLGLQEKDKGVWFLLHRYSIGMLFEKYKAVFEWEWVQRMNEVLLIYGYMDIDY